MILTRRTLWWLLGSMTARVLAVCAIYVYLYLLDNASSSGEATPNLLFAGLFVGGLVFSVALRDFWRWYWTRRIPLPDTTPLPIRSLLPLWAVSSAVLATVSVTHLFVTPNVSREALAVCQVVLPLLLCLMVFLTDRQEVYHRQDLTAHGMTEDAL